MLETPRTIINCGMYAFTDELQQAWQALFDRLQLPARFKLQQALDFSHGADIIRDPRLFIGHTCGYPLMKYLQDVVTPIAVPIFDLPGCDGRQYSSHFIVAADSDIENLQDCHGKIVAINNSDSNSGMNVLRHAIAKLGLGSPFFASVLTSGGHLHSLQAVAEGRADLAAIDCVSYGLIKDQWPDLIARVRSFANSVKTTGLPLVMPHSVAVEIDKTTLIESLNSSLHSLPLDTRKRLHLSGFEAVSVDDYGAILSIENEAISAAYAELI